MRELLAYSTFFTTVGLVASRPRMGRSFRVGPGSAGLLGITLMLVLGVLDVDDLGHAAQVLWQPMLGIAAIMVTTTVAERLGVLGWLTGRIEAHAGGAVTRLFGLVYGLAALTSAVMNNDAAVLILTPMVVTLVRRVFPGRRELERPFAFAVFMAAGVAPLVVSNPMNLVVASRLGIGFNAYAARMLPVSLAGWLVTFVMLRVLFRRELARQPAGRASKATAPLAAAPRQVLLLVAGSLVAYPLIGLAGGPAWLVAVGVAAAALGLAYRHTGVRPGPLVRTAVAWEILVFLAAAFLIALGLRHVGLVDRVATSYEHASVATIGVGSAIGSALLNNHPMAHVNMLALAGVPHRLSATLAALVGGDLGPRLFPLGSLAGLLWLESLRQQQVELTLGRFVVVGVAATLPTLVVSLAIVACY